MGETRELLNKLHIKPKDITLFETALTHPSYNGEFNNPHNDYERLEYMGDAVLDFVSADLIFKHYPDLEEGTMSKMRSYLVQGKTLSRYAAELSLADYILTGHCISNRQIAKSSKILEDVFEALVGAIYLDCGLKSAYSFIAHFLLKDMKTLKKQDLTDPKTALQEQMQAEHRDSVHYVVTRQTGPAHNRRFTVNVMFNDLVLASGSGKSKKEAEEAAAKAALEKRSV